jgi:hypothetical protein
MRGPKVERWARSVVAFAILAGGACGGSTSLSSDGGAPDASANDTGNDTEVGAEGGVDTSSSSNGGQCGGVSYAAWATATLHFPGGGALGCETSAPPQPGVTHLARWDGTITDSDATSIVIDACDVDSGVDAGATCGPLRVEVHAPGLDLANVPRVGVHVRERVIYFFTCQQTLELTTTDGRLLLAIVDGGWPFDDSPYVVAKAPLDCPKVPSCGGEPIDNIFAFDFSTPGDATPPLRVHMGEAATWASRGTNYTVRNLRSFQSGYCDDAWNWAYTIYPGPK